MSGLWSIDADILAAESFFFLHCISYFTGIKNIFALFMYSNILDTEILSLLFLIDAAFPHITLFFLLNQIILCT